MAETKISWCDYTFNPWRGCAHVSEGCRHCFAEAWAKRTGTSETWGRHGRRPVTKTWGSVPKWNAEASREGMTRRVFVGSLLDIFEGRPDQTETLVKVWQLIKANGWLDFLLLTKRPQNIASLLPRDWGDFTDGYPNVWLGTSVEGGAAIDAHLRAPVVERVAHLSRVNAVVRFVSYEPALGPLAEKIEPYMSHVDWLIAGGESGPKFRPDDDEWYLDMRDLCHQTGTAFFFKQHGGFRPESQKMLDGQLYRHFPVPRKSSDRRRSERHQPHQPPRTTANGSQMNLFGGAP